MWIFYETDFDCNVAKIIDEKIERIIKTFSKRIRKVEKDSNIHTEKIRTYDGNGKREN